MTDAELPHWHVDGAGIREDTSLSDSGTGIARVYVVPYVIDSGPARGHKGTVRVSPDEFTPARVQQAIEAMISSAHGVAGLGRRDA